MSTPSMHRPAVGQTIRHEQARIARRPGGAGSRKSGLGPRQEELLSYLQGLAPVGESFVLRRAEAMADLGFSADVVFYRALRKLIHAGHVARLEVGRSHVGGHFKVLRRLEAIGFEGNADKGQQASACFEPKYPEMSHAPEQHSDFGTGSETVSHSTPE